MRFLVLVEPVAERGMGMPGLDREAGIVQRDAFDRNAQAAIRPRSVAGRVYSFDIPGGSAVALLGSRCTVPAEIVASSTDNAPLSPRCKLQLQGQLDDLRAGIDVAVSHHATSRPR
jgi:hypothetical protein